MNTKDLFAILAFIVIFKMITSANLRGRVTQPEEPEDQSAHENPNQAVEVAPMHMPIRIPSKDAPAERIVPEKLVVEDPASDEGKPAL